MVSAVGLLSFFFFFFNDTATTEIYTLSLHDALPISRSVTLDYDVRVADRHRDRTPRIARDIASLPRARAGLEPERAVEPHGTDRGHMRATVLVDGGQPGRAGIRRVRNWRRPRSELLSNCGPIHRRQPVRLTQISDLHEASLRCPADILANGVS